MELLNDHCKIKAEIITPLSIGAGAEKDWVKGVDYIIDGKTLYHLCLEKIASSGIDLNTLASLFERNDTEGIARLLGNNLQMVSDFTFAKPSVRSSNPIKTMLRNQLTDKPLLAGSSVKGAIRSVLFKYLGNNRNVDVFGSMRDGTDFMRFIKVGDFEFEKTELVNTKIFNLRRDKNGEWHGGWKHEFARTDEHFNSFGFNTIYECLMPGMTSYGSISVSEKQFKLLKDKGIAQPAFDAKNKLIKDPEAEDCSFIENLFYHINLHTCDYLAKELKFFEQYPVECSEIIEDSIVGLKKMCKQCLDEDTLSCIIKMSVGTGFHSITGDWQYDDYINVGEYESGRHKYKSRKIAEYGNGLSLMGFVKLTIDE